MKSKFFEEVSKLATAKGFEEKGVEHGMLQLHLYGVLVAQVDESGWMLYTPYEEVFDLSLIHIWNVTVCYVVNKGNHSKEA